MMGLTLLSLWTLTLCIYAEQTGFHPGNDGSNEQNTVQSLSEDQIRIGSDSLLEGKNAFEIGNDQNDTSKEAEKKETEPIPNSQIDGEHLSSGCPFLRSQRQGGWVFTLGQIATGVEDAYFCLYQEVKKYPTLHLICFYLGTLYVLYKALFSNAKSSYRIPQSLVVLQDSNPNSFEAQLNGELARLKTQLQKRQGAPQTAQTPVLDETEKQLNDILASHQEFQQEILDSHLMIAQELQTHIQTNGSSVS